MTLLCGTYLIVETGSPDPSGRAGVLDAVLASCPAQSVLLRAAVHDPLATHLDALEAAALISVAQAHGAAALIADTPELARTLSADGVHLTWSKDQTRRCRDARGQLGSGLIVGVDAGRSRHEAMELGEAGADYVAFGIPPHVEDRAKAHSRQIDLLAWWSDVFEIPCVAFDLETADQAERVRAAGADFITFTLRLGMTAEQAIADLRAFRTSPAATVEGA